MPRSVDASSKRRALTADLTAAADFGSNEKSTTDHESRHTGHVRRYAWHNRALLENGRWRQCWTQRVELGCSYAPRIYQAALRRAGLTEQACALPRLPNGACAERRIYQAALRRAGLTEQACALPRSLGGLRGRA